ncbi:hypothetical protein NIES2100_29130 [Calothrix sp. NIES-2100]|nr:hypothetical protein NIES2100_29130 [Calothrix sp. NIES-2100]
MFEKWFAVILITLLPRYIGGKQEKSSSLPFIGYTNRKSWLYELQKLIYEAIISNVFTKLDIVEICKTNYL